MTNWREDVFNNFVVLKRGYDLPEQNIIEGKFPIVASTSIKAYHKYFKAKAPGVVTGRSGSLGTVQYIKEDFFPLNTTLYVRDFKGNYPRYVYYFLQLLHLENFNSGAGVPTLNQNHLHKLKIKIPPLEGQKKIAAVLSAYDDLIENNKRRIRLLERMAEEIYREWFVRMRFPDYKNTKFEKGVPEGWEMRPFSEVVTKNPFEKVDKDEEKPFVGMEDLSLTSMFFVSKEDRKGSSGSKFRNGDVLLPRITPSLENGKRGFVMTLKENEVGFGSTEFIVLREKIITAEHIYFLSCSPDLRKHAELSMAGASGRQRVQENCLTFFLIKIPLAKLRNRFSEIVKPYFSSIASLSTKVENLKKTRDLLLPRLISGKLSVENLAVQFPPGMTDEAENADELSMPN